MSGKPENAFIRSVHQYLPKTYHEKMANPWRSGTADVWYSGVLGDMWVEYKYVPKIPKRTAILPELSPRQLQWLNDRDAEGRRVAVVLGHPDGGVVYEPGNFDRPIMPADFLRATMRRPQLAAWILHIVGESPCRSRNSFSPLSESSP